LNLAIRIEITVHILNVGWEVEAPEGKRHPEGNSDKWISE
jgi:hypothetical protein